MFSHRIDRHFCHFSPRACCLSLCCALLFGRPSRCSPPVYPAHGHSTGVWGWSKVTERAAARVVHLLPPKTLAAGRAILVRGGKVRRRERLCWAASCMGERMCCGRQLHQAEEGLVHARVNSHSMHVGGAPCAWVSRDFASCRCMLRTLHSYPPPQRTSFPRHPQSLSHTHSLGMASYNRGLSLSEPIKAKAGTGTGLSRTSCQQESSAPMRSYVPPRRSLANGGLWRGTRTAAPCGGAGTRSLVRARARWE
jgi:hypothetical protein